MGSGIDLRPLHIKSIMMVFAVEQTIFKDLCLYCHLDSLQRFLKNADLGMHLACLLLVTLYHTSRSPGIPRYNAVIKCIIIQLCVFFLMIECAGYMLCVGTGSAMTLQHPLE